MTIDDFVEQAKLVINTKNENGDAVSWLMRYWHDLSKDELAHIAIEAMYAAESECAKANSYDDKYKNEDICAYYEEMIDGLTGIVYFPEEEV